jgi:hypothetical protein
VLVLEGGFMFSKPAVSISKPAVSVRELELESAELLPSRETLQVIRLNPSHCGPGHHHHHHHHHNHNW